MLTRVTVRLSQPLAPQVSVGDNAVIVTIPVPGVAAAEETPKPIVADEAPSVAPIAEAAIVEPAVQTTIIEPTVHSEPVAAETYASAAAPVALQPVPANKAKTLKKVETSGSGNSVQVQQDLPPRQSGARRHRPHRHSQHRRAENAQRQRRSRQTRSRRPVQRCSGSDHARRARGGRESNVSNRQRRQPPSRVVRRCRSRDRCGEQRHRHGVEAAAEAADRRTAADEGRCETGGHSVAGCSRRGERDVEDAAGRVEGRDSRHQCSAAADAAESAAAAPHAGECKPAGDRCACRRRLQRRGTDTRRPTLAERQRSRRHARRFASAQRRRARLHR